MGYTHGIKWTDEMIKQEIFDVMTAMCIKRMPSRSEIELVTGNSSLTNKISRSGGFYWWAEKLGLDRKNSETSLGNEYEYIVMNKLTDKGYNVKKMSTKHPYDLLVNENIKIDVKAAKPYISNKNDRFHTFNLYDGIPTCDIYIAIALDESDEVEKVLIIPSKYAKVTQISIGSVSKYDKYINRWDYVERYDRFYKVL